MIDFEALPVSVNLCLFAACAAGVWTAGTRLTICMDEIADRKRLAKGLVGLIFLAAATELPEIVTTLNAALQENANLVLGNMYGGIALQTTILAVVDGFFVRAALTSYPRKPTNALEASLLILLLGLVLALTTFGEPLAIAHVGAGTIVLAAAYASSIYLLRTYDKNTDWLPVDLPDERTDTSPPNGWSKFPMHRLYIASGICCLAILSLGTFIVWLAEAIAIQTGLGDNFVGATLLAGSTSLPELSTTITAARLGAYTMAISNIFGSNLIMIVLLLPADIAYRPGPILAQAGPSAQFAIVAGILVTAVYVVGLLVRRKPRILRLGIDSALVLALYALCLAGLYQLR
ncbi:MAG: sodium:calcium antiporter [Alphaproteobacteria bacterium]|nr:sodium:calcium antiporter [Alphaproteobacteria bacterium]